MLVPIAERLIAMGWAAGQLGRWAAGQHQSMIEPEARSAANPNRFQTGEHVS
jgi:hypothetical protein